MCSSKLHYYNCMKNRNCSCCGILLLMGHFLYFHRDMTYTNLSSKLLSCYFVILSYSLPSSLLLCPPVILPSSPSLLPPSYCPVFQFPQFSIKISSHHPTFLSFCPQIIICIIMSPSHILYNFLSALSSCPSTFLALHFTVLPTCLPVLSSLYSFLLLLYCLPIILTCYFLVHWFSCPYIFLTSYPTF